ncbi:hypothetical protein SAMN05421796_101786 [Chryseobacterium piscicola]|uniref:Uncharacterized protein n=2 Tax=Chryseobacterium piscicola TaxID=551459 RepID=A0A1N7KS72_9FLAO|nr:hypothetical protein B0A70_06590 [Chryseobacterium piscicola]SIS64448.1 hypothetical protein SAMN05421796_101786 [Chryseobacterium piscicola]
MKKMENLKGKMISLSNSKMKQINGGDEESDLKIGICITGVLDGIPGNTHVSWGPCPKSVQPMGQ